MSETCNYCRREILLLFLQETRFCGEGGIHTKSEKDALNALLIDCSTKTWPLFKQEGHIKYQPCQNH